MGGSVAPGVDSVGQGGEADKSGLVVPVIVEGTWDNPTWKPDLLGALQAGPDGLLKSPKDLKKGLVSRLGR